MGEKYLGNLGELFKALSDDNINLQYMDSDFIMDNIFGGGNPCNEVTLDDINTTISPTSNDEKDDDDVEIINFE